MKDVTQEDISLEASLSSINKERARVWRKENKERCREYAQKTNLKKYKLTREDYDKLLDNQGGVCAVCRKEETVKEVRTNRVRKLSVDHCHKTDKVRGLLCTKCNTALGLLKEDILIIKRLLFYIYNSITGMNIEVDNE